MAIMMGSLYDALQTAGASKNDTREAAEKVADFRSTMSDVRTDLRVVETMLAAVLAGIVALPIKTFFV